MKWKRLKFIFFLKKKRNLFLEVIEYMMKNWISGIGLNNLATPAS